MVIKTTLANINTMKTAKQNHCTLWTETLMKFKRVYLFHAVDQCSHLQLQIPEGELHLLSLLNL